MKTKMIHGKRWKMVEVNLLSEETGKVWTTFEAPEVWMNWLRDIARQQHKSLGTIIGRAITRKIREDDKRASRHKSAEVRAEIRGLHSRVRILRKAVSAAESDISQSEAA